MLLLLLPLLWQLAAAPPAWLGITDVTVIGHREAERIHIFAAGIGMLQHFTCVNALLRNPGLLRGMVRAFWVHPMWARPALFVLANTLGLWAGKGRPRLGRSLPVFSALRLKVIRTVRRMPAFEHLFLYLYLMFCG
jgi:hypothetical protein